MTLRTFEKSERFCFVRSELNKKGFNSFNKDVLFWDVIDRDRLTVLHHQKICIFDFRLIKWPLRKNKHDALD